VVTEEDEEADELAVEKEQGPRSSGRWREKEGTRDRESGSG